MQFQFPSKIEPSRRVVMNLQRADIITGAFVTIIGDYNKSVEPMLIVGCAGGTDALSGTASYLSKHPVISCPPDGMNQTCLTNPPGSSNAFCVKPSNVAKLA